VNRQLRSALRAGSRPLVRLASRAYVAGPELSDAVRACHRFARRGAASTLGYWNGDDDPPRLVADTYLAALDATTGEGLESYLSIKAPALGFDAGLTVEVMQRAQERNVGVHFDSLGPETADRTFELVASSVRRFASVGCTLPGRWRRSVIDAGLAAELGLNVRVVKGQWIDPCFPQTDLREGFLAVIDRLAGRARRVAVATHDVPLAREALRILRDAGTPCEWELLFGLPFKSAMRTARQLGVPVRVYVPYGEAWLPYAFSQVRKNPRILWWVTRDAVLGSSFFWWNGSGESRPAGSAARQAVKPGYRARAGG
jgi:proline dehydrogenase